MGVARLYVAGADFVLGDAIANSACRLCPAQWHLHRETCYWSSTNVKSWDGSRDDCLARNSQLVAIKDKEEMFLKQITNQTLLYWIGLFLSWPEKKWMWITGSGFAQHLSEKPPQDGAKYCGGITSDTITPHICKCHIWVALPERSHLDMMLPLVRNGT
ncbi:killer cell lectin-like receptor subfamily B member 1C [Podarcis muralis]